MKSAEIRSHFFKYFQKHNHTMVPSSSLIPAQDPTLLFANAGMNQFKDVFLGSEKRSYTTAVSIQKCVRAGGKHNDLDNVGFTKRHLTFFEMMGNFSFGDYFKKEAITYAWEFLTKNLAIPAEKLHASVYETDEESFNLWHTLIGLPQDRIHRLGAKDNFWQMGDVGPCGPCTEIHIDREFDPTCPNPKNCSPACDCDRFLEIWNLVFMQFDRQADGSLKELTHKGVDTGMGLERLCAVMQHKDSVFETDVFSGIIAEIERLTGRRYAQQSPEIKASFNVLADHIRSSTLIIADGGSPSNEGRGYVLRKIIRRAALFAQKLTEHNIFPELSKIVVNELGSYYPELIIHQERIYKVLQSEIEKFATNLIRGQQILKTYFEESKNHKKITGDQAFKLYDTYGFPLELIILMAQEAGFTVDHTAFDVCMERQKSQSGKKTSDPLDTLDLNELVVSEFTGYHELETESEIIALVQDNTGVDRVPAGQDCYVITGRSPFFIVGGGQVPDEGWLVIDNQKIPVTEARFINKRIAVKITAPVALHVGMPLTSVINTRWRTNAMKNHTATHLLQAALMSVLGNSIKQSGSLVHPDYLRFDFTYHENLSVEQIAHVENIVNQKIMDNIPVAVEYTSMKKALERGALAFFGDKYNPENVRMIDIDGFSVELCGGTHVRSTGDIGVFKITEVTALAAGHRRIVAVTGPKALELFQETFASIKHLSQEFKVKREEVVPTIEKQKDTIKVLSAQIKDMRKNLWKSQLADWIAHAQVINSVPYLFVHTKDYALEDLREISAMITQKSPGLHIIINEAGTTTNIVASISPTYKHALDLKKLGSWFKDEHKILGGGSPILIQGAGGKFDPSLEKSIFEWLKKNIQ